MIKYKEMSEYIIAQIREELLKKGDKLPCEKDLCDQFQVSRQTVQNMLVSLEQQGYIVRKKWDGAYVIWEELKREKMVGVLVGFMSPYIYPDIVRGIEQVLSSNGYGMDLGFSHNCFEYERRFLQRVLEMNVSAIIVEGVKSAFPNPNIDLYEQLRKKGVAIVFIHNYYREFPATAVLMEDEKLAYELTNALIRAGHREIIGCFKYDDIQGHNRYKGYVKAMLDKGLSIKDSDAFWFGSLPVDFQNVFDVYANIPIFEEVCKRMPEATAIICYNDLVAAGIAEKLKKRGIKIPEDVSFASFDNDIIRQEKSLHITSAVHPKLELGIKAAMEAMKQIGSYPKQNCEMNKLFIPSEIVGKNYISTAVV